MGHTVQVVASKGKMRPHITAGLMSGVSLGVVHLSQLSKEQECGSLGGERLTFPTSLLRAVSK